jgi:Ser/Thr protein kinase RdoA (MazF antagonist)
MGKNTPYVVELEIYVLNAIDFILNQGYSIEEIIGELGLKEDFVKHFELIKTYKKDRITRLYNAEDRSKEEQEELEDLLEDQQ